MKFHFEATLGYWDSLQVPYYLCDASSTLRFSNLFRLWTQTSINQAHMVGDQSLGWVVYSWRGEIFSLPSQGDQVYSVTIPYAFDRFYGKRNFLLLDQEKNILALADSYWLFVDLKAGRAIRIPEKTRKLYPLDESVYMKKKPRLIQEKAYDSVTQFQVLKKNIDMNRHVNNAVIIDWFEELFPEKKQLKDFSFNYKKQLLYGQNYQIHYKNSKDSSMDFLLASGKDAHVLANIRWA